jgi:hypothetical protein
VSFFDDFRKCRERFPQYVRDVEDVLRKYKVIDVTSGWSAFSNKAFREDIAQIFERFAAQEGGKVSFAVAFGIIGAALGGVGVAMMGGAFGAPLALVGAIAGLVIGNEVDSEGYTATLIRKLKAFKDA